MPPSRRIRLTRFSIISAPFPLSRLFLTRLDGLFLDLVVLVQTDDVLDILPRGDVFGGRHALVVAGLAQLPQRLLEEMERSAENDLGLDAADVAHLLQLLAREDRAAVAVAAALHVDERQPAHPGRALGLGRV